MDTKRIVALSVVAALTVGIFSFEIFRTSYEVASVYISRDAQKAMLYGQRHFDSQNSSAYNIDVADYFFWQAQRIDPETPYAYHEIARVAFLRGELDSALVFIDAQIDKHGDSAPNSYYIRGLIQGYRGEYEMAIRDYEHYISLTEPNWAALNDFAWVLLKGEQPERAREVAARGVMLFPDNPWLFNALAISHFELGAYDASLISAERALEAAAKVTPKEWLIAYPGNDPRIADEGVTALRNDVYGNMHMIAEKVANGTIQ